MCSFLFLFNEPCYHLNIWLKNLIQKVELKIGSEQQLVYECKQFLYVGLKNTNDAFSGLLFWITSTVLINMILISLFHSAHLTVFLEKILKGSLDSIPSPSVKILIMCGKVCLRCKGKTLLTNFCKQKVC